MVSSLVRPFHPFFHGVGGFLTVAFFLDNAVIALWIRPIVPYFLCHLLVCLYQSPCMRPSA